MEKKNIARTENSLYIYSKNNNLTIERLHLCTWNFNSSMSKLEIGFEIEKNLDKPFNVSMNFPFDVENGNIKSLHDALCDEKNSRYIFNDIITSAKIIDNDAKRGKILHFKKRNDLAIIPVKYKCKQHEIVFSINPQNIPCNLYFRVLITLQIPTIAEVKLGIAKKTFIYDIKVNESRNIPDDLVREIKSTDLLKIKTVFVFHVVPENYSIDFYDSNKFRSVRKLEKDVFATYTEIKELSKDDFIILFNKETDKESYSFYTCFTNEIIGTRQIVLAIAANILCSFLFILPEVRKGWSSKTSWFFQIPVEWFLAFVVLVILICYLFKRK
jgi:hypothetical protein